MSKLPIKESYTAEEMSKYKVPKKAAHAMYDSFIRLQFEAVGEYGKGIDWAKAHDNEDLKWFYLYSITEEQYVKYKALMIQVFKKQYDLNEKMAERQFAWHNLDYGWPDYKGRHEDKTWDWYLCERIKSYEAKHGELKYEDGFEKELKSRIGYEEYLKTA